MLKFDQKQEIWQFVDLYYETMKKNRALDFYYFSPDYFEKLASFDRGRLFGAMWEDIPVSMALFLEGDTLVSYHLGAKNYKVKFPGAQYSNYFLFDQIFDFYEAAGKHYALLGGGRTSSSEDPLFNFKLKFSRVTLPFYVAGKIYDQEAYQFLSRKVRRTPQHFLQWR